MDADNVARPRVVLTTTASVDGRVTPTGSERLLDPDVQSRWRAAWPDDVEPLIEQRRQWLEERYSPTVVLEGSGTFVATDAVSPWNRDEPEATSDDAHLREGFAPRPTPRYFVVVDGRGRVDWQFTGDDETSLVVLVCCTTPTGYLRRLRDLGVRHLVVGEESVDLLEALVRLGTELGAKTVIADGGGGINGALLRAGLIDELHVITFPALVGGDTTPSFLDGEPLLPGSSLVALRAQGLVQGARGSTWARYEVRR